MNGPKLLPGFLIFIAFVFPATADWARWRGPEGNGVWPDAPEISRNGGLEILWQQKIGGGFSGVTTAGGIVYTMDRQGDSPQVEERILAFDAETGRALFSHAYQADYGGLEYGSGPRASVTIHDGKAYTLGANGNIHCLDARTGAEIWSIDSVTALKAGRPKWGFAASAVFWKDTVIFHLGVPGGSYVAFDQATGKERWRGSDDPAGYATPVFTEHNGRDLMIGWTPKNIVALDPDSGEVIWETPYDVTSGVSIATPMIHQGFVLVAGYWQGSKTIRIADGSLARENNEFLRGLMSQGFAKDGVAWLLDKELGLNCFELSTGKKFWDDGHQLTPAARDPQATFVRLRDSDEFLILNSNGELLHAAIDRKGVTEHWREQLVGKTWAHPAYRDGRVFARDDRRILSAQLPLAGR